MYTRTLAHALGVSIDTVRPKPGHFATWLVDGDEPLDIPCEARPPDG